MTCQTRLLKDEPVKEDKFGSHQRVAQAIAELLKSEEGGRAIGIEGAWGSGKSTVVNLVSQHLNPDGRFEMFVFDAWAHEGDPLRRSFLEELCKFLQRRRWITKSAADHLLSDLRERRARISGWAALFGTTVLLTGLAGALIESSNEHHHWRFLIGMFLAVAPLLVLLAYAFWRGVGGAAAGEL
ncbi:MAG TPA: P-loop NTPase fold protein, partial [Polyangiaceae bacterium]|nr:P-loop NTPase fold protein [Polyangiaceae bacterium]